MGLPVTHSEKTYRLTYRMITISIISFACSPIFPRDNTILAYEESSASLETICSPLRMPSVRTLEILLNSILRTKNIKVVNFTYRANTVTISPESTKRPINLQYRRRILGNSLSMFSIILTRSKDFEWNI